MQSIGKIKSYCSSRPPCVLSPVFPSIRHSPSETTVSAAGLLIQSLGISHPLRLYNLVPHRGFLTGEYYTIILLHQLGKKGLLATVCYHHARGGKISEEKEEKSSKNKGLSLSSLAPHFFCTGDECNAGNGFLFAQRLC